MLILFACVAMIGAYVMISNALVAERVKLSEQQQELRALDALIAAREARLARTQNMDQLLSFARNFGMIAGKEGATLLIDRNVALSRANEIY